ncbi:hypothetical protein ACIO3O_38050 [Streptomyces sp. NPDC087440]|uniref:hypothetical protein n=1 Tax=Streptomyces sp. NPDC087440 TaxID=3365790 RepID=UPI00380D8CFA
MRKHHWWKVTYRHNQTFRTIGLTSPESARRIALQTVRGERGPNVSDVVITEFVTVETFTRIAVWDLPAPGDPTPLPLCPEGAYEIRRFFRIDGRGPEALRTGDDVRDYIDWLAEVREGKRALYLPYDVTEPVHVLDVRLTRYAHRISLDQLSA